MSEMQKPSFSFKAAPNIEAADQHKQHLLAFLEKKKT
jgi:hypothetical protein